MHKIKIIIINVNKIKIKKKKKHTWEHYRMGMYYVYYIGTLLVHGEIIRKMYKIYWTMMKENWLTESLLKYM